MFTEVLVERQDKPPDAPCMGGDVKVARSAGPVRDALDLMSGFRERGRDGASHTTIDQDLLRGDN